MAQQTQTQARKVLVVLVGRGRTGWQYSLA